MTAVALDATHVAAAQARLDAEYGVTLSGLPIARGTWVIDVADDQYSATATGMTSGLLRLFNGGHGTSAAHGSVSGGQLVPTSYAANLNYNRAVDQVRIVLAGGNVKDYSVDPPVIPHPDRIPVSDADRRGVVDPITSAITRVGGSGNPISPLACNRKVSVFDGRLRYDLNSEFKRFERVKADKGYIGPAAVCAVFFTPISGYVPDRPLINYLTAMRDAEVWLAPISGTRVVVPFRFSMPTPLGPGVLEATQFVSIVDPAHVGLSAKTE